MWRMLRWHAMIVTKYFTKEGLKDGDLLLPDEKEERKKRKPKTISKDQQKWFDAMDEMMRKKFEAKNGKQ